MYSQYIIGYNKVTVKNTDYQDHSGRVRYLLQQFHLKETDSDTGGTWDHAMSGRKSVIN